MDVDMKPKVTTPVHYFSRDADPGCRPEPLTAFITAVSVYPNSLLARQPDEADPKLEGYYDVSLFVIYPSGTAHKHGVPFCPEPKPGAWTWIRE
jgi:hypothetical protein